MPIGPMLAESVLGLAALAIILVITAWVRAGGLRSLLLTIIEYSEGQLVDSFDRHEERDAFDVFWAPLSECHRNDMDRILRRWGRL